MAKLIDKKEVKEKAHLSHVKVRSPYKAMNQMEQAMKNDFVNDLAKGLSHFMKKLNA